MNVLSFTQLVTIDSFQFICGIEANNRFYVMFDNAEEKYQMTLVEDIEDCRFEFDDIHTPEVLKRRESFFSEYFKSMCQ